MGSGVLGLMVLLLAVLYTGSTRMLDSASLHVLSKEGGETDNLGHYFITFGRKRKHC